MRALILYIIGFLLSTLFCSCHSKKQVQSDVKEEVRLTNTTTAISADTAVLDMVSSWSADFDSLELAFIPRDTASAVSLVLLKARRLALKRGKAIRNEQRSATAVVDSLASHRTTMAHNREVKTSANVYKPPNATIVIIIVLALCAVVLFVRLRKQ